MRALQYTAFGRPPEIREVPIPEPGPGEVLVKTTAAGVCHSDEYFMSLPAEEFETPLPLTLGHEGAGIVARLGSEVTGIKEGDPVAVYGAWGCGSCRACAAGAENYCSGANVPWPGIDAPGFMADYLLVPSPRHLIPLGDLDPVRSVPLTDAGLTPYHAIKPSLPKLVPGSTAVVIGVGGLGHLAIQILRALSPAQIVALDISEDKLAFARDVGAHAAFLSDPSSIQAVRDLTGGRGVEAVFNFVGRKRLPTRRRSSSADGRISPWSASARAPSPSASTRSRTGPASARPSGGPAPSCTRCSTLRDPAPSRSRRSNSASKTVRGRTRGSTRGRCAGGPC